MTLSLLTPVLLNPDIETISNQLIWICTVCHSVCEFISAVWIKESDWLTIRSGCGILIYSAWQGLRGLDTLGWLSTFFFHVCFSVHQVPSEKGSKLKGKNLLPVRANSFLLKSTGSTFFHSRLDPFSLRVAKYQQNCLLCNYIHSL